MKRTNMQEMWQETLINQPEFLQASIQKVLQKAIEQEFRKFIGADLYQRTDARNGSRNGSYERSLRTRVGTVMLNVCRDRDGEFKTELFERYQRNEKALVLAVIQMYIEGVSTRNIGPVVEELCGTSISKSVVSDLTSLLDADVQEWRVRLLENTFQYLLLDARYEKVRENGRVVSKAFVTAIGITIDGKREIIGCWVINSESFEAWSDCLKDLKQRGLNDIQYVVSDENKGAKKAIEKHFQGAQWQRCQVHYMRNFMAKLSRTEQTHGISLLQDLFDAPSKDAALERLKPLREFLCKQKKEPVAQWLEDSIEDTLSVYALPEQHRRKMRSTNLVERLNEELKRRSKVVRIFPNEQSCLRLLTAICMDISDSWGDRRYLEM